MPRCGHAVLQPSGRVWAWTLPAPWQQASAADGEMKGAYGGVVEATGARLLAGGWAGVSVGTVAE